MADTVGDHDCEYLATLDLDGTVEFTESRREQYGGDASPHEPVTPDAVVEAASTADVSAVLAGANERGIPVTPRSGGSGLEGNAVPVAGGIVLDTTRIDHVDAQPDDLQVRVGPGVVYDDLNERVAQYGLRFAPGISSGDVAMVGGMIANNASGFNAVRYGETGDHVRRLEVVLPDGEVIECGQEVVKSSSGYNLRDLIVGSEGTLGVVTEATLELVGIPEHKRAALVTFPTERDASSAVSEIIRFGVRPGAIEFVDAPSVELLNAYSGLGLPEKPTLLLELHGNNSGIEEDVEFVESVCADNRMERWETADESEMDEIWQARRDALPAARAYREGWEPLVIGDVVVPISKYPDIVETVSRVADELDILTTCVGHAGDGNLHFTPLGDPQNEAHVAAANELNERVVKAAIDMGGTATGEHGVGIGKRKFMDREHGAGSVRVMQQIKDAIDPNGIMNPGKVLPDVES
ncbi:FAD-binding oxidoreductase [Halospeciosus flavus]|uniref:D-lactate dehydrogenase (cytochrome) n=1 Tax=Halospeciosus flavus TaxID=3032283 RepID=A0ABD5Z9S3_9EURY|nr:FAD-binding oxidoreductase [Halospeciosus flavus]